MSPVGGRNLSGKRRKRFSLRPAAILVAHDLTPSDTAMMNRDMCSVATEPGSCTSHTAIIARSLGIPAIVGLQHTLRKNWKPDSASCPTASYGMLYC